MIHFPCKPSDPLVWDLKNIPQEGSFLCRLHLGLESPFFSLEDPMLFHSLTLALKQWTQDVWGPFSSQISGVLFYCGSADFASSFLWTEKALKNFEIWQKARPQYVNLPSEHLQRLFCADTFVHYFQMLAHSLPDEVPIHLWRDAKGVGSLAQKHHILSQERFSHFCLATQGVEMTNGPIWKGEELQMPQERAVKALCFPEESLCSFEILQRLDEKIYSLREPLRIIGEPFLTDEWVGIDLLYVLQGATTPQGERKIKGFLATGGEVIFE